MNEKINLEIPLAGPKPVKEEGDYARKIEELEKLKTEIYRSKYNIPVYNNQIADFGQYLQAKYGQFEVAKYYMYHLFAGSSLNQKDQGKSVEQLVGEGVLKGFDFPDEADSVEAFLRRLKADLLKRQAQEKE